MKTTANGVPRAAAAKLPTATQLDAIDLLAAGKSDKEAAEALNLPPTRVTRWRRYDPVFQAALNARRADVWAAGIDRLRALVPEALDALAEELHKGEGPAKVKAAVAILRLAQLPGGGQGLGPTDADEIVRQVVTGRRQRARGPLDDFCENDKGLPPFERHMEETCRELRARAAEEEPDARQGNYGPG
jgi:hypothetical protein